MSNGKRVLIVVADDTLLQMLSEQLQLHEEFSPSGAKTGVEALELAKEDHFEVIILDVVLPDIDGREVCRLMRRNGVTVPILILTGPDTILGLELGANDYITKPFRLGVLLARIRAHIRQHERSEDAVFSIGPYTFQPSTKLMVDNSDNRTVYLTDKEAAILEYLYRSSNRAVGREVLLNEVWGYSAGVTTHTLETHIYRLRKKLEKNSSSAKVLITVPGGYRLLM